MKNNISKTSRFPKIKVLLVSLYLLVGGIFPFNLYANGICERNPAIQHAITRSLDNQRPPSCRNITEAQLQNIKHLDLTDNGLTELSRKDLAGLINLKTLNLSNNYLTSLPEGFLSNCTSLQKVSLGSNKLTSLPEGFLSNCTSLQEVYLDSKIS